MGIRKIVYVFSLLLPGTVVGQVTSVMYPDFYTGYQMNMIYVNPAYVPEEVHADFTASYRFQTGAFRQISTLSFTGGKIFRKEAGSAQALRLVLSNEKQGPYISTPRGYINYAYELPLSEEVSVSAGASAGLVQKYYSGTVATGNTNALLPDAALGIGLRMRQLELGLACQQILNSKSKSLSSIMEFRRHYQSYIHYLVRLSDQVGMRTTLLWRFLPTVQDEGMAGLAFVFKEAVSFGVIGRTNSECSFYGQFDIHSGMDVLRLYFFYNSPVLSPHQYVKTSMEIGVGYSLY